MELFDQITAEFSILPNHFFPPVGFEHAHLTMGITIILQYFQICRWNCGRLLIANIHSQEWINPQDSKVPNRSRCYPKPVHLLPSRQWEKGLLLSKSTTNPHSIDITSKCPWVHAFLFILASTVQGGQWKTSFLFLKVFIIYFWLCWSSLLCMDFLLLCFSCGLGAPELSRAQ